MKVPHPTWCPNCRNQRRMTWRNERSLYRRKCNLCSKDLISVFSDEKPFPIYCYDCYHSDKWDPLTYGISLDFSKPFLEQFKQLQAKVPRQYALLFHSVNSDYTNAAGWNKNCYLIFVSDHNEDSSYLYNAYHNKNSFDLMNCRNCEFSYDLTSCTKCHNAFYSADCRDCYNIRFSRDCVNCHDLLGCVGLRGKQYQIFNKQYSKEEYETKVREYKLNTIEGIDKFKKEFAEFVLKYPVKYLHGIQNLEVTGDNVSNSKNSQGVYFASNLEDSKNIINANFAKDCQDGYVAVEKSELCYEFIGAVGGRNTIASHLAWYDIDSAYTDSCEHSSDIFGCVSLKKNQYCILNKQYTKEEYEELVPRVIQHMKDMPYKDKKGRAYSYGDFFPAEISPHNYNETVAQEHYPLTKDEALEQGYAWKEEAKKDYSITVQAKDLPNNINEVTDDILKQIIECEHKGECKDQCSVAFRITPQELKFYKKEVLPLPKMCSNCRHYERLEKINPFKLWHRRCMCDYEVYENSSEHAHHPVERCENEFETSYAPEKKDIVYGEVCYNSEIA